MAVNRDPIRVYGRDYAAFRDRLRMTDKGYDNGPDVLRVVNTALAKVPYYRDRYGDRRVATLDEVRERIGFLDRSSVAEAAAQLVDPGLDPAQYDTCSTGGTSGPPLRLLAPKRRYVVEHATMHSLWERAGFAFHPRAVIRNHRVPDRRPYVINPITREVIFDGFRLDGDSIAGVVEVIRRLGLRFIHCYPSHAYEIALRMLELGVPGTGVTFLSGSETVHTHQRETIEQRLGARFYNWYGHSEKLVLAGYCASTHDYHVEPLYGFFELIDERGQVITRPGTIGEIVGTSLHNPGMPLIRYRTGDFAEYVGDHCAGCRRNVHVIRNVRGRWSGERIYRADGSFITTTALNLHDELNRVVDGLQYVQEARGELIVHVVKSRSFTHEHDTRLRRALGEKLGDGFRIEVRYVEQLARLPNGKFSHLISRIPTHA